MQILRRSVGEDLQLAPHGVVVCCKLRIWLSSVRTGNKGFEIDLGDHVPEEVADLSKV